MKKPKPKPVNNSHLDLPPFEIDTDSDCSEIYEMASSGISDTDITRICEGLEPRLQSMIEKAVGKLLEPLTLEVTALRKENDSLKQRVASLELTADAAEQYSRRNCLRISGIAETAGENTDTLVLDVAEKLGVPLTLDEISRSHRVGRPPAEGVTDPKPRSIIFRLVTYRIRQRVYKARTKAKEKGLAGVYINEDLTKFRNHLLYQARLLLKAEKINGAWSSDGRILIKDTNNKVVNITTVDDLTPFR